MINATQEFRYSADGVTSQHYKAGDKLTGEVAKWATENGYGIDRSKKPTPQRVKEKAPPSSASRAGQASRKATAKKSKAKRK
jgi:hypothetical protein